MDVEVDAASAGHNDGVDLIDLRAPTPTSPSSTSGESLSGADGDDDDDGRDDAADAGDADGIMDPAGLNPGSVRAGSASATPAAVSGSSRHSSDVAAVASTSTSSITHGNGFSSGSRRKHHHHHSLALGTGAAKMGSSITDSAQSTEDELEDDKDNDMQIHYPALATPTAKNGSFWPFGVVGSSVGVHNAEDDDGRSDGTYMPHENSQSVVYATDPSQHYAQVAERSSSSKAAFLPHEILLKILRNVRATQDLVNALLVCKSWCQCGVELLWNKPLFPHVGPLIKMLVILSRPVSTFPYASFIKRLNFSHLADRMSDALLQRLTVCERLERLTLAGCSEITDEALTALLAKSKNLVALDLSDCAKVTDKTVIAAGNVCSRLQGLNLSSCKLVTDTGMQAVAKGCPMLRRVKLRNLDTLSDNAVIALALSCPLLLEVDLYTCSAVSDRTLWALYRNCSHLRELSLNNCTSVTGDGFPQKDGSLLYIKGSNDPAIAGRKPINSKFSQAPLLLGAPGSSKRTAAEYMESLPHLQHTTPLHSRMFEHVRYLDLTALVGLTDQAMEGIVVTMPHIRNLVLAKCSSLTDASVLSIAKLGKYIHFLHLGHVSNITDKAVIHLARSCTRLRYIDLACCPSLTDLSVFELAAHLPRLKRIGLVRVSNLTDQAIVALSSRTTLERIHLSYCEHITVSAVQYLLDHLRRLNHLSLTGVPAFRRPDLQHFCRPPPKGFNPNQRSTFCVYSGKGVHELRSHLDSLRNSQERAAAGTLLHHHGVDLAAALGNTSTLNALELYMQAVQSGSTQLTAEQQLTLATQFLSQQQQFEQQQLQQQQQGENADMDDDVDEDIDGDEEGGDDENDDRGTLGQPYNTSSYEPPLQPAASGSTYPQQYSRPSHRGSRGSAVSDNVPNTGPSNYTQPASSTSTLPPAHSFTFRPVNQSSNGLWPAWQPQSVPDGNLPSSLPRPSSSTSQAGTSHFAEIERHSQPNTHTSINPPSRGLPVRTNQPNHITRGSAPASLQIAEYGYQNLPGSRAGSSRNPADPSHYLNIGGLSNLLDESISQAAAEQDAFEAGATDGDQRMRSVSPAPLQLEAPEAGANQRAGRPRRDTIRQSTFLDRSSSADN